MCGEMWECRRESNVAVSVRGMTTTENGFMDQMRGGKKTGNWGEEGRLLLFFFFFNGGFCLFDEERMERKIKTNGGLLCRKEKMRLCAVCILCVDVAYTPPTPTLTYFARSPLYFLPPSPSSIQYGYHLSCVMNI